MAKAGIGYFDSKGEFFRTLDEATLSDLAALLGRLGDGEGLALGIAKVILRHRRDIERLFAEHDAAMDGIREQDRNAGPQLRSVV